MKKFLFSLMAVACIGAATAQPVVNVVTAPNVGNRVLGSGDPTANDQGSTASYPVGNDMFHAPQYMPGYPTAATIFPRVVDLKCQSAASCDGYNWSPALGRGEYLYVRAATITPPLIEKVPVPFEVIVPGPERIILKEVPPKKKRE